MSEPTATAPRHSEPPAPTPARGRFSAAHRLVAKREFAAALRGGRRTRGDHVQLIAAVWPGERSELPAVDRPLPSRLGLSVSKGVGNAPERARMRRLLREAFRALRGRLKASCDMVVIAKSPWPGAHLADVAGELVGLMQRLRLTTTSAPTPPRAAPLPQPGPAQARSPQSGEVP